MALDAAPGHDALTVMATSKRNPWTHDRFSTVWHRGKAKQAEGGSVFADLTLKGRRHTVGTILREGGLNLRQIADYLGQSEEAMAH